MLKKVVLHSVATALASMVCVKKRRRGREGGSKGGERGWEGGTEAGRGEGHRGERGREGQDS